MKNLFAVTAVVFGWMILALSSCSVQDDKVVKPAAPSPAPAAKAEAKVEKETAKPIKAKGDVGLMDTEKNYMILVTKEGKLITLDFDQKTKVTKITPTPSKIADIGLGSLATVEYQKEKDKNVASKLEYRAAKGGD